MPTKRRTRPYAFRRTRYGEETTLKKMLRRFNMTVPEFANAMGYSVSNTYEIVSGKRKLRSDEIVTICEMFSISADWLLGLKGDEEYDF